GARRRAERLFEVVAAGLGDERRAALRLTLLGRPDPHPTDLQPRPALGDDSLDDMAIRTLHNLHERLLTEDDLSALLQSIVEAAIELTGAERGFLVLEEDGELHFDLALDSARGGIARPELETSRTIVTDALTRGRPLRLSNAADDPSTADHASVMSLELRSILCVPFDATPDVRGVLVLDHRLRTGAFDERAEELAELVAGTAALAVQKVYRSEAAASSLGGLERTATPPSGAIIGSSPAMSRLAEQIARIAPSELSVLIVGASGTGKELAARALFDQSLRSEGPFVAENCAALPPSLIESELFGHRRGAFTGADRDHAGLFERAHGGTLFLDEIGELPLELQARLLRVLENGELRRVGDDRVRRVDVRLLTATNRDLEREVDEGRFRQDLLYRLDGARIAMPTLGERREDIPELVRFFLERISERTGVRRRIAGTVLSALVERPWPGNVRELKNEVERLAVLTDGDLDDPSLVRIPTRNVAAETGGEIESLAAVEQRAILRALEASGGDKREAARKLGISRAKIYQRLKEWSENDVTDG
ncbi:MAG: sigma-54-dependent Fis family transcriptional regulator, partial [Planctomycetota bacterium]